MHDDIEILATQENSLRHEFGQSGTRTVSDVFLPIERRYVTSSEIVRAQLDGRTIRVNECYTDDSGLPSDAHGDSKNGDEYADSGTHTGREVKISLGHGLNHGGQWL